MLRVTIDSVPDDGAPVRRVGQLHIRNLLPHARPHVSNYSFTINERSFEPCACGQHDMGTKPMYPVSHRYDGLIQNHPRSASPWRLVARTIEQFLCERT